MLSLGLLLCFLDDFPAGLAGPGSVLVFQDLFSFPSGEAGTVVPWLKLPAYV